MVLANIPLDSWERLSILVVGWHPQPQTFQRPPSPRIQGMRPTLESLEVKMEPSSETLGFQSLRKICTSICHRNMDADQNPQEENQWLLHEDPAEGTWLELVEPQNTSGDLRRHTASDICDENSTPPIHWPLHEVHRTVPACERLDLVAVFRDSSNRTGK